eukprot:1206436-Amphidinium_carterae.1
MRGVACVVDAVLPSKPSTVHMEVGQTVFPNPPKTSQPQVFPLWISGIVSFQQHCYMSDSAQHTHDFCSLKSPEFQAYQTSTL